MGSHKVGKTTIVEGLAQRIVRRDVPEGLKDAELYELDMSALIAGASYRGQFEERLKAVLKQVKESEVVLFYSSMKFIQSLVQAKQMARWMLAIC